LNMSDDPIQTILSVVSVSKKVASFDGELTLISDINFSIIRGESVAVVGASGAGKSTLLGILAGLDTPSSGKVTLAGKNLFDLDEDGRAQLRGEWMGFVFQSFQLLPSLTAWENVMLPLELMGVKQAKMLASDVLERVGLAPRLHHYPRQLSGGEQQRVAIARAFAPEPKLLLADEPTGNLDSRTGEQVINLLFELNQEKGATLILVTHDNALARRCDRILTLDAGQLMETSVYANPS